MELELVVEFFKAIKMLILFNFFGLVAILVFAYLDNKKD